MALAAYRSVLRAARIAFQDDMFILDAAFERAREGFETYRGLAAGSAKAQRLIKDAHDVAKMLRTSVVQGKLNEEGRYELRIHDEIERGDNESIKQPKSTLGGGASSGKCCSS